MIKTQSFRSQKVLLSIPNTRQHIISKIFFRFCSRFYFGVSNLITLDVHNNVRQLAYKFCYTRYQVPF